MLLRKGFWIHFHQHLCDLPQAKSYHSVKAIILHIDCLSFFFAPNWVHYKLNKERVGGTKVLEAQWKSVGPKIRDGLTCQGSNSIKDVTSWFCLLEYPSNLMALLISSIFIISLFARLWIEGQGKAWVQSHSKYKV